MFDTGVYVIGISKPLSLYVNTFGTAQVDEEHCTGPS